MIRAAILGATGYTASELIELLLRHPNVTISNLTTRQEDSPDVASIHPRLLGQLDLKLQPFDAQRIQQEADVVFSCLPHAASAEIIAPLLDGRLRVIDFSADYRLTDLQTYESWYKTTHPDPNRIGSVPYGLCEFYANDIANAELVANPGCYPTSAILALTPLLRNGLIEPTDLIIDSKTGVSGAGKKLAPQLALQRSQRKLLGLRRWRTSSHTRNKAGTHQSIRKRCLTSFHASFSSHDTRNTDHRICASDNR